MQREHAVEMRVFAHHLLPHCYPSNTVELLHDRATILYKEYTHTHTSNMTEVHPSVPVSNSDIN